MPYSRVGPFSPWFQSRMTPADRELVASIEARGVRVIGFAAQRHGPFTARAGNHTGAGSSPAEALARLAAKVAA